MGFLIVLCGLYRFSDLAHMPINALKRERDSVEAFQ